MFLYFIIFTYCIIFMSFLLYANLLKYYFQKRNIEKRKFQISLLRIIMGCLKSIFFIPFVESYLSLIFCKNEGILFGNKYKCFNKTHNIFFIISIICLLILIYLTYLFIAFSFSKAKDRQSSISKYLIMNSSKSFFFNKIAILIIQSINAIYSIKKIICFSLFCVSYFHLYCFLIEYHYQEDVLIHNKIYFYLNFIYIISTTTLFLGYIVRKDSFEGLIYLLFLGIIIIIALILIWPEQTLKNSIFIHFKNEYVAYNETRLFINSIKERKLNRGNLLNFLVSYSYNSNNLDKAIEEENFINHLDDNIDYKISQLIENNLKNKINQFNGSILLKCAYAIFLYDYLTKYNKAFLIILSLYEDITQGIIHSTLSQEFYIYRIKRSFESNFKNLAKNNKKNLNVDLSTYFQINSLIYLILKSSEIYYDFWNILFNCSEHKDIVTLEKLGNIINKQIKDIHEKFNLLYNKKLKDKKIIILYIYFIRDVLNEYEMSNKIIEESEINIEQYDNIINEIIGGNNKVYNLNEIESNSNLQFIISSGIKDDSVGLIQKISHDFSKKLGYSSNELIGKSINILLPDFLREKHEKIIIKKFSTYNFKEEFKSPKKMKGLFYMRSNSMYLIPIYMETYLIFDEDYLPYSFTRLENEKEIISHQNSNKVCHILTNKKFIIQNFTTNTISMLNLTDKDFNGTVDVTDYIKEFNEDVKRFYLNKENLSFHECEVKTIILKKKYFIKSSQIHNNNIIKWKKNNKSFFLYCEDIKMNNESLGYYFHFEKYQSNNSSTSSIEKFESSINEQQLSSHLKKKIKPSVSITNTFVSQFQNPNFIINPNIIPNEDQIVEFDFKNHSYLINKKDFFNKQKNQNLIQPINEYVKDYLSKNKNTIKTTTIKSSDINSYSSENESLENESDYSVNHSSESFSSNFEEIKNENSNLINNNTNNFDYYKVNLNKISLFYFDFSKNLIEEVINYPKENIIELMIKNEKNNKIKFPNRRDSTFLRVKRQKMKYLNESNLKQQKKKELKNLKNDEMIKNITSSRINKSIYFLFFSILLSFIFSTIFSLWFGIFSIQFRKSIFSLIDAINCLKILNGNIIDTFYYSVKLTVIQNPKYINVLPSKNEIKKISRLYLFDMYNQMISLLNSLYFNSFTFSSENEKKIKNYKVNLTTLTDKLRIINFEVPVLNLLEEFTCLIYTFIFNNDSNINFLNINFNNLFQNSQNLIYGKFINYTNIYEDEYKSQIKKYKIYSYCLCFILLPFEFFGLYLILKSNFKVSSENEKFINVFFQIDKKTIISSINNCKKFIKATDNINNTTKHLVSTPKINLDALNKSIITNESSELITEFESLNKENNNNNKYKNDELEEEELSDFSIDDNENNEINKEKLNTTSNFFKFEKKAIQYLFFYILYFCFFTLFMIFIIFLINIKYDDIKNYQELFTYTQELKIFIIRNVIYFRIFIIYESSYIQYLFLNDLSKELANNFKDIFEDNSILLNKIYLKVDNNFLSKSTKLFYKQIQKNSLCYYLDDLLENYKKKCEDFGFGIANFGLNSISMFIIHSVMTLYKSVLNIIDTSWRRGFLYSELFYNTPLYIDFSESIDESELEDFYDLDPFSLFNNDIMNDLIILNDYIFKESINDASKLIQNDLKNIRKLIGKVLIYLFIFYTCFFILFSICYIIPDIINKNNNINKRRKILMIIPKNILLDIINKNNN